MDDRSRRLDMPPDADMVDRATQIALRAAGAINVFHQKMSWQLGRDGSHASSHSAVSDLAEALEEVAKLLSRAADEGEARATTKFTQ